MFAIPVLVGAGLLGGRAWGADLEGTATFGLFPGVAGVLERPSRLAWESAPLVAVGASLDVGSPELDLSTRGERWTGAMVLAAPLAGVHDVTAGAEDEDATRSFGLSADPWIGFGIARQRATSSWGLSLVGHGQLERAPASLDGTALSSRAGTGTLEWKGDRPTRGIGSAGHATGQDLDTALRLGFARTEGATRPRLDLVGRYVRAGEFVEVAEGFPTDGTTGTPFSTSQTGPPRVTSIRGANPSSFWSLPNRSAAALGATVGLDRGGTLRDPRARWELGAEGGPTWTTFTETVTVSGRYTPERNQSRVTLDGGGGYRVAAHLGGVLGWLLADDDTGSADGTDPRRWRVRSGLALDGFREDHQPVTCRPGAETVCTPSSRLTEYAALSAPTAVVMGLGERVTATAGVSPTALGYRYRVRLEQEDDGEPIASVLDMDFSLQLGARAALEYSDHGWALGAAVTGYYGYGASVGGAGGFANVAPDADLQPPPRPDRLAVPGPVLSLNPVIWIGWRPAGR